jgi:hypothetical protein
MQLPNEVAVNILACLDRSSLDVLQLVCRRFLVLINKRMTKECLRALEKVFLHLLDDSRYTLTIRLNPNQEFSVSNWALQCLTKSLDCYLRNVGYIHYFDINLQQAPVCENNPNRRIFLRFLESVRLINVKNFHGFSFAHKEKCNAVADAIQTLGKIEEVDMIDTGISLSSGVLRHWKKENRKRVHFITYTCCERVRIAGYYCRTPGYQCVPQLNDEEVLDFAFCNYFVKMQIQAPVTSDFLAKVVQHHLNDGTKRTTQMRISIGGCKEQNLTPILRYQTIQRAGSVERHFKIVNSHGVEITLRYVFNETSEYLIVKRVLTDE